MSSVHLWLFGKSSAEANAREFLPHEELIFLQCIQKYILIWNGCRNPCYEKAPLWYKLRCGIKRFTPPPPSLHLCRCDATLTLCPFCHFVDVGLILFQICNMGPRTVIKHEKILKDLDTQISMISKNITKFYDICIR